jgi:hypothetical protein
MRPIIGQTHAEVGENPDCATGFGFMRMGCLACMFSGCSLKTPPRMPYL